MIAALTSVLVLAAASPRAWSETGGVDARPASVFTVTDTNDANDGTCSPYPGHCSLREAIAASGAAPGADAIDFHSTVTGQITLASALPHLSGTVSLAGPGAGTLTLVAASTGSVLWVDAGATVTVSGLTLTGGVGSAAGGSGGGAIANHGTLTIANMVLVGNSAQVGGAIYNDPGADVTISTTTIRGNTAYTMGSAIYSIGGGTNVVVERTTISGNTAVSGALIAPAGTTLQLRNSTITANIATQTGGVAGIWGGINVTVQNSTIVGNTGIGLFGSYARNTIVDSCGTSGGVVGSLGNNLAASGACFAAPGPGDVINPNFLLGPLQNNGGPTETMELLTGSPAIDTGHAGSCPATDQRGHVRPAGSACDIGAYEYRANAPPPTVTPTATRPCAIPPGNMVAWYPLDEAPGANTVQDILGPHNGVPVPGAVAASAGPGAGPIWGAGALNLVPPFMVNGSLYFWDQQRLIDVPHSAALDMGTTGDFTIDTWLYTATSVGGGTADFVSPIVDKYDTGSSIGYGLYVRHTTAGTDHLELVFADGTTVTTETSIPPLAQTSWQHVAATVDTITGGQLDIRLYVNGVLQGSNVRPPPAMPIASSANLRIAGTRLVPSVIGNVGYTEVALDELELFGRALSQAEIQALVNAGRYGKCRSVPDGPSVTPTRTPMWPWQVFLAGVVNQAGFTGPVATAPPRTATPTQPALTRPPTETPTGTPRATDTATVTDTPRSTNTPTASATTAPSGTVTPTATRGVDTPTATRVVDTPTASATATDTPTPTATDALLCAAQPAGMSAWWPMDEKEGPEVWEALAGRDGAAEGGATPLDPGWVAAGRNFDGINGLIRVTESAELDPSDLDFSLDAWIKPGTDGYLPIISKQHAPADAPLGWILYLDGGRLGFDMSNEASNFSALSTTVLPVDGLWHLVALTIERGSATGGRLYVDGAEVGTFGVTFLTGAFVTTAELHIGEQPSLGRGEAPRYFTGGIDEVELFHRAITGAEIAAMHAAGQHGKCEKPRKEGPTPRPSQVPLRGEDGAGRLVGEADDVWWPSTGLKTWWSAR